MGHPSRNRLDRYAVRGEDEDVENHLRQCAVCREYLAEVELDRQSMLEKMPAAMFSAAVFKEVETRRRQKARVSVLRYAAAAAVLLVCLGVGVYLRQESVALTAVSSEANGLRWMGDEVSIRVFAKRSTEITALGKDEVREGDALRFQIQVPDGVAGYAAVFATSNGVVSPILPGRVDAAPFSFTTKIMLPGSLRVEKDSSNSEIWVYVSRVPFVLKHTAVTLQNALRDNALKELDGFWYRLAITGEK